MRILRHILCHATGLRLATASLCLACAAVVTAQTAPYKFDFGAELGMSG